MSPSPHLTDRVDRDPVLSGAEKETTITMYGDDEQYTIYSAKPTIIKSLLDHDHFRLDWLKLHTDADETVRVGSREAARQREGAIVGIRGRLPIGTLTVKSEPRADNHQSSIVSAETIDASVFEAE